MLAGKRKAKVKAIYLIKINFAEQVFRGSEFRRVYVCNILAVVLSSLAARKHGYGQLIGEAKRGETGGEKKSEEAKMEREDNKANPHEQNGGPSDQINEEEKPERQRKFSEKKYNCTYIYHQSINHHKRLMRWKCLPTTTTPTNTSTTPTLINCLFTSHSMHANFFSSLQYYFFPFLSSHENKI